MYLQKKGYFVIFPQLFDLKKIKKKIIKIFLGALTIKIAI